MKDLAVIMSVYINDRLEFVKESVSSILNQTFKDFAYYISFDGPVSQEVHVFLSSLKDERISLFQIEKNGGLARALNFLLEKVLVNPEYHFIARMDADDISMPDRLEKQRKFLLQNPHISVVGSWYEDIDEKGRHLSYHMLPTEPEKLRKRYYTRTPFAHPTVMYTRSFIQNVGSYPTDTILMEDNVLWGIALFKWMKFANIPEYLLKFRIDRNFYRRRSGIKYGWNYVLTRFRLNKILKVPIKYYFISLGIGVLKMIPSFLIKPIYHSSRK